MTDLVYMNQHGILWVLSRPRENLFIVQQGDVSVEMSTRDELFVKRYLVAMGLIYVGEL